MNGWRGESIMLGADVTDREVVGVANQRGKPGQRTVESGQSSLTAVTSLKGLLKGLLRDKAVTGGQPGGRWLDEWLQAIDRQLWVIHELSEQAVCLYRETIKKNYGDLNLNYTPLFNLASRMAGGTAPVGRLRFRVSVKAARRYGLLKDAFVEPFVYDRISVDPIVQAMDAMMNDLRLSQPDMYKSLRVWDSLVHQIRRDQLLIKSDYLQLAEYCRQCEYASMYWNEPELAVKSRELLLQILEGVPEKSMRILLGE
jgi:hypothetical protein